MSSRINRPDRRPHLTTCTEPFKEMLASREASIDAPSAWRPSPGFQSLARRTRRWPTRISKLGAPTTWSATTDGFNGLLPHLESALAVVLVSKDPPDVQRKFANSRGWRFRLASHGGGDYIREQGVLEGSDNFPGAVLYQRNGDAILRRNACLFGPGDLYCAMWGLLGLAGLDAADWTPQFNYWQRPAQLDDGGKNVLTQLRAAPSRTDVRKPPTAPVS